jgi:NADPH2:quinone reductase
MRVIVGERLGGPEVLKVAEQQAPRPGPGEVVVEVAAAGVNFMDIYQREGVGQYHTEPPFYPGAEGAGTVAAVGEDVTGLAVGDHVAWAGPGGSYAEEVVLPAKRVVPVPDGISLQVAGAALLQGMTAHYLLFDSYPVKAGDTVLVHAAAGGMGLLLTQLATRLGARVIGTVSTPEKAALATAAGAAEVLVGYTDVAEQVRRLTGGEGVPAVYDGVGNTTFEESLASLRLHGVLVLYGQSSGPVPPFDLNRLNGGGSLYVTRPTLAHFVTTREELTRRAGDVLGWIADGSLNIHIGGRYPLEDAAQAHRDLQTRRTTGKLLLIP